MTFDMQRVLESKRALRGRLAELPVAEKLAMLDALRDRARTIRWNAAGVSAGIWRQQHRRTDQSQEDSTLYPWMTFQRHVAAYRFILRISS